MVWDIQVCEYTKNHWICALKEEILGITELYLNNVINNTAKEFLQEYKEKSVFPSIKTWYEVLVSVWLSSKHKCECRKMESLGRFEYE